MTNQQIIKNLPYTKPFLFVNEIVEISENGVKGTYKYDKESFFYKGHFKDNPITPGVILTETMAQIGVVCLGIYLLKDEISTDKKLQIALTANQVDFYIPVLPEEKMTVISEKIYFRFNKLKCKVKMFNQKQELVCRGEIAGMIVTK